MIRKGDSGDSAFELKTVSTNSIFKKKTPALALTLVFMLRVFVSLVWQAVLIRGRKNPNGLGIFLTVAPCQPKAIDESGIG